MKSFNKSLNTRRGFTLIELLVVIAIIGLLSSIILGGLNVARSKARDSKRKQDLRQLQTALALYYDTFSAYPSTGGEYYSSDSTDQAPYNGGNYIPGLAPNYISALPRDPRGGTSIYFVCNGGGSGGWKPAYVYRSDGVSYKLISNCAPENAWSNTDAFYDPVRPTWSWMVCSGATACSSW